MFFMISTKFCPTFLLVGSSLKTVTRYSSFLPSFSAPAGLRRRLRRRGQQRHRALLGLPRRCGGPPGWRGARRAGNGQTGEPCGDTGLRDAQGLPGVQELRPDGRSRGGRPRLLDIRGARPVDQAKTMLDKLKDKKVYLVNNFGKGGSVDFELVNKNIKEAANGRTNVKVLDWKAEVEKKAKADGVGDRDFYKEDGYHINETKGRELYIQFLKDSLKGIGDGESDECASSSSADGSFSEYVLKYEIGRAHV